MTPEQIVANLQRDFKTGNLQTLVNVSIRAKLSDPGLVLKYKPVTDAFVTISQGLGVDIEAALGKGRAAIGGGEAALNTPGVGVKSLKAIPEVINPKIRAVWDTFTSAQALKDSFGRFIDHIDDFSREGEAQFETQPAFPITNIESPAARGVKRILNSGQYLLDATYQTALEIQSRMQAYQEFGTAIQRGELAPSYLEKMRDLYDYADVAATDPGREKWIFTSPADKARWMKAGQDTLLVGDLDKNDTDATLWVLKNEPLLTP
jgi:hypothetical protein